LEKSHGLILGAFGFGQIKMAIEGTYGFVYSGSNGLGVGVFRIDASGKFHGVDYVRGRYTGTAHENADGTIAIDIEFDVMPGEMLVQGTSPQEIPYRRHIQQNVPAGFADGEPFRLNSPPGYVTVMVKRVPDEFAIAVTHGVTINIGGNPRV
jgi:hypothetical protein